MPGPEGRSARYTRSTGRLRSVLKIAAAVVALALVVLAIGLVVLSPRLTVTDRERLRVAREVPYQAVNLIDHDAEKPRHYYLDMRTIVEKVRAAEYGTPALDTDGVPLVDYTIFGGTESGVKNPITTAQYALGLYEEYLVDGEVSAREAFLTQADWLVSIQSDDGGFYFEFDLPSRALKAPWLSAMAQGEGMSVLVRAYYETDDERYLEAAELALRPLRLPIADGGLMHTDETGVWLEEYPTDPPAHVLNGAIFTVFGLRDLVRATG
ncbi:MAG: D-glucuronyl C5-epimerase family protein, partial [Coriobacteriia bacterium]|nr:D-glucuronyl C5-epimerase family protein [Coriobacteriia bacterium]